MITASLLLAASLATQPKVDTWKVPKGQIATEIARHGDAMVFVSWTNWPALEPNLGRITKSGTIATKPLVKDHMPGVFAEGPDQTLWLSDAKQSVLWKLTADGDAEQVVVEKPTLGLDVDDHGTIWCSHPGESAISAFGADGAIQATNEAGRKRYKLKPAAASKAPAGMTPQWTRESRRANRRDVQPNWIVSTATGVWFTDPAGRAVGRFRSDGEMNRYRVPSGWGAPGRAVSGPDGLLWFVVGNSPILGQVSDEGTFGSVDLSAPAQTIATDSKGRVWFSSGNELGFVDRDGAVHPIALPKGEHLILSMAEGPDGAMWFVDQKSKTIGRVTLP